MSYRVMDRENDGNSAVQFTIVHDFLVCSWIEDSNEDGVLTLGDGIDAAPHLHINSSLNQHHPNQVHFIL